MDLTNFRDLGGLVGFEGKKVKEKLILRSGEPVGLSEGDVAKLTEFYGLAHIIDFRGEKEISVRPVDIIEGTTYINIDIMASVMKKSVPSLEEILKNATAGSTEEFMTQAYTDFVLSDDAKIGYRKFIDVLLNPQGALLFHCFAGKDRTGWGAVILLKILGVNAEDVMVDYMATNDGRKAANDQLIEEYRIKGFNDEQLMRLEEILSVKASYLETAFSVVKENFGTFDDYLVQVLNVTDEEVAKLRELYLV